MSDRATPMHELPQWVRTVLSMTKKEAASALWRNSAWRDELPKLPVEARDLVARHLMPDGMEEAALSKHEADAARAKAMNMTVMIEGLSKREDLNMRVAKVIVPPKTPDDKRVGVELLESGEKVRVHEDKLIPMEPDDVDGEIACMMNPMDHKLFLRHHGLAANAIEPTPPSAETVRDALRTMETGAPGWSPPSSLPGSPPEATKRAMDPLDRVFGHAVKYGELPPDGPHVPSTGSPRQQTDGATPTMPPKRPPEQFEMPTPEEDAALRSMSTEDLVAALKADCAEFDAGDPYPSNISRRIDEQMEINRRAQRPPSPASPPPPPRAPVRNPNLRQLYAFLGVRGRPDVDPQDMETNTNYCGKYTDQHGQVELFFRETRYAGYDVFHVVCERLTSLGFVFEARSKHDEVSFSGGEGQILMAQDDFAKLCEDAAAHVAI